MESPKPRREKPDTQMGLSLPRPISGRLDVLVAIANDAGERTSRAELVAALIAQAHEPEALREFLVRFRLAVVRDVVIEGHELRHFLEPSRRKGLRRHLDA